MSCEKLRALSSRALQGQVDEVLPSKRAMGKFARCPLTSVLPHYNRQQPFVLCGAWGFDPLPLTRIVVESLLHSKAECGIWVSYKKSPITSAKFCRRMPVIRIGHGSTVLLIEVKTYCSLNEIRLHCLEVVGCSKLSTYWDCSSIG